MTDPLFPSSLLAPLYSTAEMRAVLDDSARVQRMLDFEAALARAEAAVGIVPPNPAGLIAEACQARHYDLAALGAAAAAAGNLADPLIEALTAYVAKRNPRAAGYVHWGASSQDVIDTAMALELRAVIDVLFADLDRATKAFITLSGKHRRNMTMARTLLQQALPMPFGLKLAGYAAALARSRDRLRRLRKDTLVLQFGGGAGTLAALDDKGLDVSERLAAQLDLPLPDAPWHSHRDRFAEVAAAFAILAGTCGKIARDVALLMQTEIGEAFEPGASADKRNPVGAVAALSAAMVAPNLAATILNAQIHEHERAVGGWQAEWVTFPALALVVSGTLRAVVEIAEGLIIDVERMKANLEASGGLVLAEAVVLALAEKLGQAEARALVEELAQRAVKDGRTFKDVVADHDKVIFHLRPAELERLFMPNHYQGSAQTFIDRLVASSQGRAVRRSASVAHLTEPKMPAARPDHLTALSAATAVAKPAAAETNAPPQPTVTPTPAAPPVELGQAVAAAAALIEQTIAELGKPATAENKPAAPQSEPTPAAVLQAEASAEPAPPPAQSELAVVAENVPIAQAESPQTSQAEHSPDAPKAAAEAPPVDKPADEAPGALLEVFARAAENENVEPDDKPAHKRA